MAWLPRQTMVPTSSTKQRKSTPSVNHRFVRELRLSELSGHPSEMADLQRVLDQAPAYAERVTGAPPGRADAQSMFTILPDGKTYEDKYVFGIYLGSQMVGCADLIKAYPRPDTVLLGLLLIAEPFQGQGIGSAAYRAIEDVIRGWNTCAQIRLGVVRTNAEVLPFWTQLGFIETGESKPYRYGPIVSETIILVKSLLR